MVRQICVNCIRLLCDFVTVGFLVGDSEENRESHGAGRLPRFNELEGLILENKICTVAAVGTLCCLSSMGHLKR